GSSGTSPRILCSRSSQGRAAPHWQHCPALAIEILFRPRSDLPAMFCWDPYSAGVRPPPHGTPIARRFGDGTLLRGAPRWPTVNLPARNILAPSRKPDHGDQVGPLSCWGTAPAPSTFLVFLWSPRRGRAPIQM